MVVGLLKFALKLEQIDPAVQSWKTALAEAKESEPLVREKLQGSLLLIDRKTGHGYSLGLWSTAADSEAFAGSELYKKLLGKLGAFCVQPPTREQFEVRAGSLDSIILGKLAA